MKTIFVPITSGIGEKNIIISGVLDSFARKVRVVVLTLPILKKEFRAGLSEKIAVESFYIPSWFERKMMTFRHLETFSSSTVFTLKTDSIKLMRQRERRRGFLRYYFARIMAAVSLIPFVSGFIYLIQRILFKQNELRLLFNKYKPELVFSTDIFNINELAVLEFAKDNKIPIAAFILSWDNLTKYGRMPVFPDRLILWNDIMKDEAILLHKYPNDKIVVTGNPSYDFYFLDDLGSREDFFREIGADSNRKLITYATVAPRLCKHQDQVVEVMVRALEENKFKRPSQLLVLPNPKDEKSKYEKFQEIPYVMLNRFFKPIDGFQDKWLPSKKELSFLARAMKFSDVVVNIASTIAIEAAVFDTPVIGVAFNGYTKVPYLESSALFYDFNHYQNIVRTGGSRIVHSPQELVESINLYLENQTSDKEGRAKIVKDQVKFTDGKSAEKVVQCIFDFLQLS